MEEVHPNEKYRSQIKALLDNKVSEFQMLGYEGVTRDILWECLIRGKWKKIKTDMHIHQVVSDVYGIRVTDFMNQLSFEAIKAGAMSKNAELDLGDLKDLF